MDEDLKKQLKDQFMLIFSVMKDDEFVDTVATFSWKLFSALKGKGFTDDQAMKIVAGMSKSNK